MAPPNKGPRTLDMTNTDEMMAMYVGYLAGGTMRGVMTVTREYIPEPPMPWMARRMMLVVSVSHLACVWIRAQPYSCSMVFAKPHAIEKTAKSVTANRMRSFVPSISLSLA